MVYKTHLEKRQATAAMDRVGMVLSVVEFRMTDCCATAVLSGGRPLSFLS